QTSGTLTVTDVDTGEAHFSNTDVVGNLGTLHLTDSGAWTYDLDNTNPTVQALGKGATATDIITVQSADGTTHKVTITVNGINDKAVIAGTDSGAVTEESQLQASGTLTVTDVDTGEAHFSNTDIAGTLGTLHLTDSGAWSYDLDNTNPTVQALSKGATATDTITVQSADGTTHKVTITVNGTNDKAVIAGTDSGAVTEESQLQTSGTLTATDVDTGEAHFSNTDVVGTLGTLHLKDNGAWTYDLDNTNPKVQALGKGATATDTITVHSADGTPHQVKITVNGTNDKAVIAGTDSGAATEESQLQTSGTLTVTDVDTGEAHFSNTDIAGTLGTLHLKDNGAWTYDLDNTNPTVQELGKGATATDTITVNSADGTPHQITIAVNGTNDTAVIGGSSTGAVTEETQLQTSGTLTVTDTDTGEAHFANTDIQGTLGTLHLTDNGAWTYNLDNTNPQVQSLAQGATTTDVITVNSADGTPHQITITVNGTNDAAVVGGVDTASVTEKAAGDNMSPDHAQPGMATLRVSTLNANGHLSVVDPDSGQSGFADNNVGYNYHGTYGDLILNPNGDWNYFADAGSLTHIGGRPTTRGSAIDKLGEGETLTDTITVHTKDGTPHNIVITINGSNDRPYCSSEVQLNAGTEDTRQTITAAQLLQNSIDVDKNDSGLLTVANLHPDHGSILDNQDGTYTFTPEKDYNGQVHFTYDVKDAHGGTTHTGANTTLVATPDKAIISEVTTGSVIEDGQHANHNNGTTTGLANGQLQVIDSDSGEDKFQYSQFGETRIHDPFGGMLRIDSAGNWEYSVDNSALQHLAQGQVETVTYRVHSFDGTAYDLNIDVVGTNDAPTVTKVVLSNGTEDTHYQMQASQFGFTDIDTGDTLHSIAITDLPPATQGKFVLDGHDVTAGQHIPTADISKLQFVPAQDFNGDVQFKYTVNDGHTDSTEASNTLHIDAVGDSAVITGTITGDVDEGHGTYHDRSPNYAQPGMAKLTNDPLYTDGKLEIIDPDTGEAQFDTKGVGYSYHGTYGQLILNADGNWHYKVTVGSNQQNVATQIDQLGDGQQLTDTITVYSKDGTAQDIVITIHGDNDRPYISSEVTLATGTEDTALTFTKADLLANTVDVDANDAGKLSIANLLVDHGSVVDNKDGTYTFTPDKDYNGQVHFAYDVKDAHGGVTHTGASTTLAAVDDKTIISGVDHGVATEDVGTLVYTNSHIMDAVDWQALQITDVDSPNTQVTVEFAGKQYTWNIGSDLDVTTPYGRFQFHTIASGPHQGEHSWSYIGDNNNVHVQELKHGESFTESIKLIATDGTEFPITVKVNGTEDGVVIDSNSELGHVVENAQTGASVSGNVVAHDVDLHDTVSWTQTPTGGISGQYGTFHLSADGQWHYDVDQSKATKLGDGDEYWEHFTVEAVSTDGSHVSKSVSVVVHGNNDVPTVSGEVTLPSGKEDTSIHITQAELIANATDVDTSDKGWLHAQNLTADHGSLVSNSDGSFTFNPDPNYNGTVHFTYDVADRHGGIAHTGANTTLAAVNDVATFTGDSGSIGEDTNLQHNIHISGQPTVPDALVCQGHLVISDVDGQGEAALDLKGQSLVSQDGTYGHFIVKPNGSWLYTADNNSVPIQDLDNGQTLTDSIEITSKDGTKHSITVTINGTTDAPTLHSLTDSGIQNSGPIEGNLITGLGTHEGLSGAATDTDSNAHLVLQDIQIKDPVSGYVAVKPGQPHTMMGIGTLAIEANGHYTFTPEAGFSGKVPNMVYRVGDEGGNPIGDSSQNSLSIEVTPPQPNTVSLALATGSDSGSKGDLITNDNTPSVEGHTLIPNSSVDIVENGKVIGTTVSDGNGDYHLDLPGLTDATHTLQAIATDPLSSTQVQSHPMALVIDTTATVAIEPISTDSMLTGSERTHSFDITGSVTGVEDGQTVQIELEHQTYQGQVSSGKWHVTLPASLASSLQGGVHQVTVSVTDNAGNQASIASPLFVVDGSNTPPLPTMQTPHITGGGGVGSHVTGDLIAPPLLQQLHPQVGSGWGILAPDGSTVTRLHGQFGTLVIDPKTGHVDYQYSSAPTPGQKAAGGTHWAGQTTSEQHHDVFQVMYHDTHSSNVDVKVNLDVTYTNGHSGHNHTSTNLVGMSVTPVTPTVQHDEPAPEPDVIEVTLYADDDSTHHDLMAGLSALADVHSATGSNPYTDIVGLHDAPQADDSAMPTPEPAPDLDLLLNQADDLAHQHPVDAFIDDNGEEHKADDQHVLDEEHIQHNLPDVMDLPDHHH
ncbi:VCBS domain-containing protein, partial [Vibrio breoganii]